MSRFTQAYDLHNMEPGPAGSANVQTIYKSVDGIILAYGTTKPTDSSVGYAEGCLFVVVNGSGGAVTYINEGTALISDFNLVISEDNISAQAALLMTAANANTIVDTGFPLYGTADDGGPSPLIWSGAPILDIMLNPGKGFYVWEDFLQTIDATEVGALLSQTTGSGTFAQDPSIAGGVCVLDNAASTANHATNLAFLGMQCKPAVGTKIRFEVRLKVGVDDGGILIGLIDDATTDALNSGTIVTNQDMVVFFRDTDTTAAKMGTQTCDGTNNDSSDDDIADVDKDVYETFGIVIDGDGATAGDTVTYYHNGVLKTTGSTLNTIPDAVMCPTIAVDNIGDTTQMKASIDWMRLMVYNSTAGTVRV